MIGVGRVFVRWVGREAVDQVALARVTEASGLDGVWFEGSIAPDAATYALVTAAAAASVTRDLRLGVVLSTVSLSETLRLAEDLAVLDQSSSGRAELWLSVSESDPGEWTAVALRLLGQLRRCEAGGRTLAVTPGPLQPSVPVLVSGAPAEVVPAAGAVVPMGGGVPGAASRVVLLVDADETALAVEAAKSTPALLQSADRLRGAIERLGAEEVVFDLGDLGVSSTEVLGAVVAPILRATDEESRDLVYDTVTFRRAVADLR